MTDKRVFRAEPQNEGGGAVAAGILLFGPRGASYPRHGNHASLDSWEEARDDRLTARAIGRAYSAYGVPLGHILLPEGQTASGIVRRVLETGLREAGYRTVTAGSPDAAAAPTLRAEITDYWGWSAVGTRLNQITRITLLGDWPLRAPPPADEPARIVFQTTLENLVQTEDDWKRLYKTSHADLRRALRALLR